MKEEEVVKVRGTWTLHTLADTRRPSSEDNRQAATAFLEELRRRRAGDDTAGTQTAADSGDAPAGKPTFRKPTARTGGDGARGAAAARPAPEGLPPGLHIAEECLAGSGRRRRPDAPGVALVSAQAAKEANASKKRGAVCLGMEEDE